MVIGLGAIAAGLAGVFGGVLAIGSLIANFFVKLTQTENQILFWAMLGVDAFAVQGFFEATFGVSFSISSFILWPLNVFFQASYTAVHLFALVTLIMVLKFALWSREHHASIHAASGLGQRVFISGKGLARAIKEAIPERRRRSIYD